jgi:hypothetical protein
MAGEIILPSNTQQNVIQADPRGDVISPYRPWAGAFAGLGSLPSPYETMSRPWFIAEHIKWLMLRDSQVFAGYMLWKTGVLVDGMQLYPSQNVKDSSGKVSKERQKKAAEIAEFCLWNLNNIRGGFHSKLLQLLDCSVWGHKAASQVYRDQKTGQYKDKLVLDRLRIMPNDDYRVKTDQFGVVVGLQPIGANGNDNIYDIRQFAWCVFRPYDDHPLGTNLLWPTYNSWYEKQQIAPERLANMAQFGSPSMWAKAPQNLSDVKLLGKNGQPLTYPATLGNGAPHPKAGKEITIPVNTHILNALQKFEGNGSVVVLPFDSDLQLLEAQGDGQVFKIYSDDKNLEIIKAIFFTTSWTEQEKYGSNSKSKTGAQIGNSSLIDGKKMLADMVEQSILEPLIIYNFGEEFVDLCPEITFGNLEAGTMAALYNSIAALWSTGFFDASQRTELCRRLGLPMPDPNQKPVNEQTPTGNVLVNNKNNDKNNGQDNNDDNEED